jgi:hypothetical protein
MKTVRRISAKPDSMKTVRQISAKPDTFGKGGADVFTPPLSAENQAVSSLPVIFP